MNLCCLCLFERTNCLNIFGSHHSTPLSNDNLSIIISKYFWFEPKEKAFKSNIICSECWEIVKNFHELYIKVEEAHKKFTNIIIKIDLLDKITEAENNSTLDLIKQETDGLDLHISDEKDERDEDYIDIDEEPSDNTFKNIIVTKNAENFLCSTNQRTTRSKYYKIIKSDTEDITKTSHKINLVQKKTGSKERSRTKVISARAKQSDEYDKKVSSFMILTCDLCSEVFGTFSKLKTHFRNIHNLYGYAVCCNRKLYKRNLLIDHIDIHLNPDHFKCPTCGKTFTNKESHQIHIKTFHLPERIVYECDECPKKFSWRYLLIAHKKTHAPKEEWKYKCKDCDKTFASHNSLNSHKHYMHRVNKKFCDLCGKSILNSSFREHQLKHNGIVHPKIQCEICCSWVTKRYIKRHLKNHDESGIDHICIHCGKKAPNINALASHIYKVHTLKKTVKCSVCEKTFKSKDLLNQHMPVHTGENNYSCQYCSKTFKFRSNWHDHKKTDHPVEFEEARQRRLSKVNLNGAGNNIIGKLTKTTPPDSPKMEEKN